jgi:hypothetical protein
MSAIRMGRTHRILVGIVVAGAVVIAAIGFAGSYTAVRNLALHKGFGAFSNVFPIGVDAGIVVLLALDLLLTWFRIPFPLLRQTAWLLTAATIAFNGAAAWPDPLGVGMHAVIPVLFVVCVEAARHAIGRIADITADRHMESVRIARWLLAFPSTFRLWRRMKLWELRSYDEVIRLEQDRMVYRARLHAKYGRAWKRKAPVESLMPLRLARYGVPLTETAQAGLAAAGITVPVAPPAAPEPPAISPAPAPAPAPAPEPEPEFEQPEARPTPVAQEPAPQPAPVPEPRPVAPQPAPRPEPVAQEPAPEAPRIPVGPGRYRSLVLPEPEPEPEPTIPLPEGVSREDAYYEAYRAHIAQNQNWPNARQFVRALQSMYGGDRLPEASVVDALRELHARYRAETMDGEYVP